MRKNILITGTSTGFGRATAETLAQAGHRVFASMRRLQSHNKCHSEALQAQGVDTLELDVTDDDSIGTAVESMLAQAGKIDVVVNNAGVASAGVTEAFTPEQMAKLFDINVVGVHRVVRKVLPTMRQQNEGLIINVGSILGRVTFPFFGMYGASKYAVEALSDSLRYEVSQHGVEVALLQPSAYPTQMYASVTQPKDSECAQSYGEVGDIPGQMFAQFMSMFESDESPNPQDVADAIADIIAAPRGQRPTRKVVGAGFGADVINQATAPVQSETVNALGLGHLDKFNG